MLQQASTFRMGLFGFVLICREGVREVVGGVAMAKPIFQVLFPKAPKPKGPKAQNLQMPERLKAWKSKDQKAPWSENPKA